MTLVSIISALINPYTYKIFLVPLWLSREQITQTRIMEMQSPNFHHPAYLPFEMLILLALLLFLFSRKKIDFWSLAVTLLLLHESLARLRSIPYFTVFALPLFDQTGNGYLEPMETRKSISTCARKTGTHRQKVKPFPEIIIHFTRGFGKNHRHRYFFVTLVYRSGMIFGYPLDDRYYP